MWDRCTASHNQHRGFVDAVLAQPENLLLAVHHESAKAIEWIESITKEVEVGGLYLGKVTRIMGFGAFVEILPGKEGLVRIGELADYHVPTVEDVVQVGDEIMVVVIEIDRQGRVNLSRKAAMQRHLARNEEEGA